MKKTIFLFLMLFGAAAVFGQSATDKTLARQATDELAVLYNLDKNQVSNMQVIQGRRFRQYSEIAQLESQNYKLYLQKRKAIRLGAEASMKKMFTKEQMTVFNQQVSKKRKERSEHFEQLKASGLGKEEIELALLAFEG